MHVSMEVLNYLTSSLPSAPSTFGPGPPWCPTAGASDSCEAARLQDVLPFEKYRVIVRIEGGRLGHLGSLPVLPRLHL